jgi:hypothetical protein
VVADTWIVSPVVAGRKMSETSNAVTSTQPPKTIKNRTSFTSKAKLKMKI